MYGIIKKRLLESTGMFTFNFLECTPTIEDVDNIFRDADYKRCLLLKNSEIIIIANHSQLLANFSGSTGLSLMKKY